MLFLKNFKIVKQNILFVLLGFIVFSSFTSTLCIDILHLPMLLPEILFIPFIFLLKDKFSSLQLDKRLFQKMLMLLTILVFWGIVYGEYEIGGILSVSRSFLYMIIAICYFNKGNNITNDDIQWFTLGSLLGWLYDSRLNFAKLLVDFDMANITYGLLLAFPLFFSIVILKKRFLLVALGLAVSLGVFVFAGLRRIIAVFLISLVVIFVIEFLGSIKRLFAALFVFLSLVLAFVAFYDQIESFVFEASPQLHTRMFVRTEQTLSGDVGSSDNVRMNNYKHLEEQGLLVMLPKGMYTNHTSENGAGIYNDMPFAALTWVLGLPLAMVLVVSLMIKTKRVYNYYKKSGYADVLPYVVSMIVMFAMLYLDGSFISYVYCAPITGMCIGKILYYSKYLA